MSINNRIKAALATKGITQSDLANKMGVGQTAISNQLRGKDTDSIRLVNLVSELTGLSIDYLIKGEEKWAQSNKNRRESISYKDLEDDKHQQPDQYRIKKLGGGNFQVFKRVSSIWCPKFQGNLLQCESWINMNKQGYID